MSGVTINGDVVDAFTKVKSGKAKFAVFRISDDKKTVIVDENSENEFKRGGSAAAFEQFREALPEKQCRYGVYYAELACKGSDGIKGIREKLIFVTWAPDNAGIRDKMLIASSKDSLKKAFIGINYDFQFSCEADTEAGEWIDKIGSESTMKIAGEIVEFEGQAVGDW